MTIHNPWGLKLSKKDIEQGWRFCYVEELLQARPSDAMFKMQGEAAWSRSQNPGLRCTEINLRDCTYITKTVVPQSVVNLPPWAKPAPAAPAAPDELDVLTKFLGGE